MKKYKCIQGFTVDKCDGDGFTIEECGISVEVGTVWYDYEEEYRFIGGEIRLENEDETWIEIPGDNVNAWFEEVQ